MNEGYVVGLAVGRVLAKRWIKGESVAMTSMADKLEMNITQLDRIEAKLDCLLGKHQWEKYSIPGFMKCGMCGKREQHFVTAEQMRY